MVRPAAGALLAAGAIGIGTDLPPWVGVVAGILAAGGVHAGKAVGAAGRQRVDRRRRRARW